MKWSVLDRSPAAAGVSQDVAIRDSLALALFCDARGFHRYWVSDYHNSDSTVGTAPEVLMAVSRLHRDQLHGLETYAPLCLAELGVVLRYGDLNAGIRASLDE